MSLSPSLMSKLKQIIDLDIQAMGLLVEKSSNKKRKGVC
jgi:hypothetical protein